MSDNFLNLNGIKGLWTPDYLIKLQQSFEYRQYLFTLSFPALRTNIMIKPPYS